MSTLFFAAGALIWEGALLNAANIYIAPDGSGSGNGTARRPYDVTTALSGDVSRPGDTFWLRKGIYQLGQAYTEIHGEAGRPVTFRGVPGDRVQLVGSLTIGGKRGHLVFRDFELYSGVEQRVSKEKDAGFTPKDIPHYTEGIQDYAPDVSFINLVVHDSVRSGFFTSSEATNVVIYGCIVYNSGWASPDNAEGHSFYLQAAGEVSDNMGFNSTGAGFHVYSCSAGDTVRNITLTGNIAWGAGALQSVRLYRDWIVGVDSPALTADNIVLRDNMGYGVPNTGTLTQVQLGRENANGSLVVESNYWPQGLMMSRWSSVVMVGNMIAPDGSRGRSPHQGDGSRGRSPHQPEGEGGRSPDQVEGEGGLSPHRLEGSREASMCVIELEGNLTNGQTRWNSNHYFQASNAPAFRVGSNNYDFGEWKKTTGYDSSSSCSTERLHGTKVFVRPNRYERGRANIVVYNWDSANTVEVNVGNVLSKGAAYEVRNAQDFYSEPVLRGIFNGEPLRLPMKGLSTAKPMARLQTAPETGPTFNVFVLLSNGKKNR